MSAYYEQSRVGSGLTADTSRDLRATTNHADIEAAASLSPPTRTKCILCVDDEIVATAMRADVLREHGYGVVVHHSPYAVPYCDLSVFDLAILDFQMPGLNGRELLLRMRALWAKFPIILLTGCLEALSYEDRNLFARCIDKSMPIGQLLEAIAEYVNPNQKRHILSRPSLHRI